MWDEAVPDLESEMTSFSGVVKAAALARLERYGTTTKFNKTKLRERVPTRSSFGVSGSFNLTLI